MFYFIPLQTSEIIVPVQLELRSNQTQTLKVKSLALKYHRYFIVINCSFIATIRIERR